MNLEEENLLGNNDLRNEPVSSQFNPMSALLGILFFPFTIFSCFSVQQQEAGVVMYWGHYSETITSPGLHWSNMWGRDVKMISTKKISIELPKLKIVEKNGNPLIISAVVVFSVVDAKRAMLDVSNASSFVATQAETVLKQVISRYPYESPDNTHCLKTEAEQIGREMCDLLQDKIRPSGCRVFSFQLKEISYASEIAAGMLRRQQAVAMIAARQTIVTGAVDIAVEAIASLRHKGIVLDEHEQARMVTNILTVICSDKDAQPTVPLGDQGSN